MFDAFSHVNVLFFSMISAIADFQLGVIRARMLDPMIFSWKLAFKNNLFKERLLNMTQMKKWLRNPNMRKLIDNAELSIR